MRMNLGTGVKRVLHTIRQQIEKSKNEPNIALADFIAPKESTVEDYIGMFAVTAGIGIEKIVEQFEKDHDDYNSIMTKALADRLAEAFAEHLHKLVRKEYWGYAADENYSNEELIKEKYYWHSSSTRLSSTTRSYRKTNYFFFA